MRWVSKVRQFFSADHDNAPRVSRRHFLTGAAGAAVGGGFLLAEAQAADAEERARHFGIEPGTLVDAQGRPRRSGQMGLEPFIAEISMFAGNFAPRNWAFCNGQLLPINQNQALYALIGTIYGGDGRTTFALPDLRGRTPLHWGQGPGLSNYTLGQEAGAEQVTLTPAQMPNHTHTATTEVSASEVQVRGTGTQLTGLTTGGDRGAADAVTATTTLAGAGSSQPHENRPPYLAISFIIALSGIFPSRN